MKQANKNNFLDIVLSGPDMSGTSTQIEVVKDYYRKQGLIIKDLRGTENHALFHAEIFNLYNEGYESLDEFLQTQQVLEETKNKFLREAHNLLAGYYTDTDLLIASCIKNDSSTFVNPNSADVWIFEEPTRRGAGQVNRAIEQNRSKYECLTENIVKLNENKNNNPADNLSEAYAHQAYRTSEFLRFRKPLRDAGKIIVRSRSEESACYQIFEPTIIPKGISIKDYVTLPGHKYAFGFAPTNILLTCGPENWTEKEYLKLKAERSKNRKFLDDYEKKVPYQLLVNQRYAGSWIDELYNIGCAKNGGTKPQINRIDIYKNKEETKKELYKILNKLNS